MVNVETVAHAYASYRAAVLPADASSTQVLECERAFHAGAFFLLMNLASNIAEDTDEDDGVRMLERLKAECEAYVAQLGQPLAADRPAAVPDPPNYQTDLDAALRPLARDIGRIIGDQLPEGWGFALLLFTFGPGGALSYISNADRGDMLLMMREFIQRQTQ